MSQQALASRVAVLGYDLTRGTLAKIEAGIRAVSDVELFLLAHALGADVAAFVPKNFLRLIGDGQLRPFHVRKSKAKPGKRAKR